MVSDKSIKESTKILEFFAARINPDRYLEIGVRYAQTINIIAKYAKHALGVDPDRNCKNYISQENIEFFNGTSDFFFDIYSGPLFDMIFIDGLHEAEQVERDFFNSLKRVSPNGWIFLHDTFPPDEKHQKANLCGDVWRFIYKFRKEQLLDQFELLTLPWAYGITCIRSNSNKEMFL